MSTTMTTKKVLYGEYDWLSDQIIDNRVASKAIQPIESVRQSINSMVSSNSSSRAKRFSNTTSKSNSTTSSYRRPHRIAEDGRPIIPKRTSSRNLRAKQRRDSRQDLVTLHQQSVELFSSLNGKKSHPRSSVATQTTTSSQLTGASSSKYSSRKASYIGSTTSETFQSSRDAEDNPLGYTLARKRTSLPPIEDKQDRQSKLSARASYLSNCSSFLSSFPQPPVCKSPPPLPQAPAVQGHGRSTSKYRVFPPSQDAAPPVPDLPTSRPPITTTCSYSSHDPTSGLQHSQENEGDQGHRQAQTSISLPASISWTSPQTRLAEYAKIDQAYSRKRKIMRMIMPKWMCGSLGGERSMFYRGHDGADVRSVRRYRVGDEEEEGTRDSTEGSEENRTSADSNDTDLSKQEVSATMITSRNVIKRRGDRNDSSCNLLNEKCEAQQDSVPRIKRKRSFLCF